MNTTGYYGKVPLRGDFVAARLPTTFINTWDDWSQQLVTACNDLENNRADTWQTMPAYRFYLSPGIAGDNAWVGVTLPSKDSVGRLFPFCVARDIDASNHSASAMENSADFFESVEQLIRSLFSGDVELDQFRDSLEQLDSNHPTEGSKSPVIKTQSTESAISIRLSGSLASDTQHLLALANNAILNVTCSAHSIWTTSPLSTYTPETIFCEFMPSESCCAGLVAGHYESDVWTLYEQDVTDPRTELSLAFKDAAPAIATPIAAPREGDTQPVFKTKPKDPPREADFLELDDNSPPDAPWEN